MKDVDETMQFLALCVFKLALDKSLDVDELDRVCNIMNGYDCEPDEE